MGKDLNGKELGKGLRQKSNCTYSARYVDRFGNRRELYDKKLSVLKRRLETAIYDDRVGNIIIDSNITLSQWFKSWKVIQRKSSILIRLRLRW